MPFRDFADFKPHTLRDMTAAYDAATARLGITKDDPRTSELAFHIVSLVKAGEHDPKQLCDLAVAALDLQRPPVKA